MIIDVKNFYVCLTFRAQSRTSNHKTWDRFPSSVGGNSLGNVPEVFVNEVFGNVARTLWESFPCVVRSTLFCWTFFDPSFSIINHNKTSGNERANTYFKAQLAEGDITEEFGQRTRSVWATFPKTSLTKSSGMNPKIFPWETIPRLTVRCT